ncbi:conserved hypothetical protein [Talaromyces stipitatus ATCC 10500]|uniref:Uncharacterized protein n=1 Tax=Talaromyces stipitatus (strain ATCC 10500 / CBS 375.48 / QM 6759 / NRRL 1006) TaxID=441959 RepID=B8M5K6_TALSN|nr:uncharacterized protein TSTA_031590 [Talaromyces stipitatus ATCC 10500]EED19900.1 conserved hypothetical protein [Talaromyces stipitatus ATCC 10500]
MRVAELINDYRTLQLHISQQLASVSMGNVQLEGYRVLAQSSAAAQRLLATGFTSMPIEDQGSDPEMEKAQLRQVILDASVRRFQAHKIYLRVAAAKRWVINRNELLARSSKANSQVREVDQLLRQELDSITDHTIFSDLRQADSRAGLWVSEDPPLAAIQLWINNSRN